MTWSQLPINEIYMLEYEIENGEVSIINPTLLTGFNKSGYNNQPHFFGPDNLYITSNHYERTHTDFIRLDLENEIYYRITATDSISEFSPTSNAPDGFFSAVRIEADQSTQSLWLYPDSHEGSGHRVLYNLNNVGYHCWLSSEEVALFLVTDPITLHIGNINTGQVTKLMENIGRCLKVNEDGELLFVHKLRPDLWYIKSYDLENKFARIICQTRPGSEDFDILEDGSLIMAEGSRLFRLHPDESKNWESIADLSELGISEISRIETSRDKIAIVNTKSASNE